MAKIKGWGLFDFYYLDYPEPLDTARTKKELLRRNPYFTQIRRRKKGIYEVSYITDDREVTMVIKKL